MSEGESLGLAIFTVVGVACYAALFVSLFAYAVANALQPPGVVLMIAALTVLSVAAALGYTLWECQNGSAFSYVFTMHGTRRLRHRTWRIGTLLKTVLLGAVGALLVALVLTNDIDWYVNGLRLLSPASSLDALLVAVCFAFPVAVLAIYAAGNQFDVGSSGTEAREKSKAPRDS